MITASPFSVLACATCMADKGSLVGQAQGYAILFMLGMLAFMFLCAACFVYSFVRRQRAHQHLTAV
jgi:hypothetical protein